MSILNQVVGGAGALTGIGASIYGQYKAGEESKKARKAVDTELATLDASNTDLSNRSSALNQNWQTSLSDFKTRQDALKAESDKLANYYKEKQSQDYFKTAPALNVLTNLNKLRQKNATRVSSQAAMTGATDEAALASNAAAQEGYNTAVADLGTKAEDYRTNLVNEENAKIGIGMQKENQLLSERSMLGNEQLNRENALNREKEVAQSIRMNLINQKIGSYANAAQNYSNMSAGGLNLATSGIGLFGAGGDKKEGSTEKG
jgi:hypothetical protein